MRNVWTIRCSSPLSATMPCTPSIVQRLCMLAVMSAVCSATGCYSWTNAHTRLPTVMPDQPARERRAYEYHDPFPDSYAGPQTMTRPRGFNEQRTEPRRAFEKRIFQQPQPPVDVVAPDGSTSMLSPIGSTPPPPTVPSWEYPHVVRP